MNDLITLYAIGVFGGQFAGMLGIELVFRRYRKVGIVLCCVSGCCFLGATFAILSIHL